MRLAAIAPWSSPDLIGDDRPYNLIFTEAVLERPDYAAYWRNHPGEKIMDSLIHERKQPPSLTDVCRAIELADPTYVIVPDVLYNPAATKANLKIALEMARSGSALGRVNLVGVPQGNSILEFVACAEWMLERIRFLGLNQGLPRKLGGNRGKVLTYLKAVRSDLRVHMLGITPDGQLDFEPDPAIMGYDSAKPVYQALYPDNQHRPEDYFQWSREFVDQNLSLIKENLSRWDSAILTE